MEKNMVLMFLLASAMVPVVKSAIPGSFFWQPRMAIDLSANKLPVPGKTRSQLRAGVPPTKENIRDGSVVLINGYQMGLTIVCLAAGVSDAASFPHFNPLKSYFYTDVYRWWLRYIASLSQWMQGDARSIIDSTKLWRKRFYNVNAVTPKLLRHLLFYIPKSQWDHEDKDMKLFQRHAMKAFAKHLRQPRKKFDNFKSFETEETKETESSMSSDED